MRGAILHQPGDTELDYRDDLGLVDTGPGMVRVAIKATGFCHSDLSVMNKTLEYPVLPVVLGHEGAGEVVEIGAGVTGLAVGDHVVIAWTSPCGKCPACINGRVHLCISRAESYFAPTFTINNSTPAYGFIGCGTFADELLVRERSAIKIDEDVPFEIASLIGCAVTTGVGAVINTARLEPGSSVIVFGAGGVGISVIQGARLAGAAEIVAVDTREEKHEIAKQFGATHAVTPEHVDDIKGEITGGLGFDYAFEAIGLAQTMRASYDAIREGGTACIVGMGRLDDFVQFNAFELFGSERRIIPSLYGSANPHRDFPRLLRLWRAGRLDLEGMITQKRHLRDINQAVEDMKAGKVIRTVLETN